jgi:DNA-binding MarR family transcriptional regulator
VKTTPESGVGCAVQGEKRSVPNLKTEIAQGAPFSSLAEEAMLNLMRGADCLHRAFQRRTKPWGVTSTQYNVLRILRGAQPKGLTCSAIGERMITAEPDITRLLGRLKAQKLVRQQRDHRDRRVVWTQIATPGLALLTEMDPVIQEFPKEMLGHLDEGELTTLVRLLESARKNCGDPPVPVTCDGTHGVAGETCLIEQNRSLEPSQSSGRA